VKRTDDLTGKEEVKRQKESIERLRLKLADKKLTYYMTTYGCQMNAHDSEKLKGILEAIGYTEAATEEEADFALYNTCAVRENAENRVYGHIGHLKYIKKKNPKMIIALCGCMMQQPTVIETLRNTYKHIDIVFGTHNLYKLAELLEIRLETKAPVYDIWQTHKEIIEDLPSIRKSKFKASVNIMYGCNNFCTFCIVPYVRGRERSRQPEDIIAEIRNLVKDGVKEIMLLGQNVNSYGKHLENNMDFAQLLSLIEQIEGLERIRFMTPHPKDLSEAVIDIMAKSKVICPHIHLPIQSGSTRLLKKMNRRYTKESYLELVRKIRQKLPEVALSTDIIVGFPGETDADIEDTLDVIRQVAYNFSFTFIYSKRTGTPAADMEDQVLEALTKERFNRVLDLVNEMSLKNNQKHIGKVYEVLIDNPNIKREGWVTGRLRDNSLVHLVGDVTLIGTTKKIKIVDSKTYYLVGEPID